MPTKIKREDLERRSPSLTVQADEHEKKRARGNIRDLRNMIAMHNFISHSSVHSYNHKQAKNRVLKVVNGLVLRNHKLVKEDFWVKGNKIIDPQCRFWDAQKEGTLEPEDLVIDAKGSIIAPGYLDIQINGAFGVDFSDPEVTAEDLHFVAANLVRYGVTGFLPTVVSSHPEVYRKVLPILRPTSNDAGSDDAATVTGKVPQPRGAINLGIHVEGPFLSKEQKGAHDIATLEAPSHGIKSVLVSA